MTVETPGRPLLLEVEAAASALGLRRATFYKLLSSGDIESVKIGARRLVPYAALEAYVERLRAGAA